MREAIDDGIVLIESERRFDPVHERIESLARDENRQTGCGSLEDDLVERADAHVVDERVGGRVHLADPPVRHRLLDPDAARPKLLPMTALLVGQRRTDHHELRTGHTFDTCRERLEPLGGRRAPDGEEAKDAVVGSLRHSAARP